MLLKKLEAEKKELAEFTTNQETLLQKKKEEEKDKEAANKSHLQLIRVDRDSDGYSSGGDVIN